MKRFKKMFILLGVLAVVCVATIIVKQYEEKQEKIRNTDEVLIAVENDQINKLSWEYDGTSLSFHKDTNWQWDDDADFPVSEDQINKLLSVFNSFGAAFAIDDVEDYAQYGLKTPVCTIKFSTDSKDYEVKLGAYSTLDSQRYVSIGDGRVYLVKNDPFSTFEIELTDMIQNDETPSATTANQITFSGNENYTITYGEDSTATYCESDRYFTTVNGKKVPLSNDMVENYVSTLKKLDFSNYVTYNATSDDLEACGLDNPSLTINLNYTVTEDDADVTKTFVLNVGLNKEELAKKEASLAAGEEYSGTVSSYARVADSQIIYSLTSSDYNKLILASYNDLRHDEVFTGDFEKVTGVEIEVDGAKYTITSGVPEDGETLSYYYNSEETDVTGLRSTLTAMTVSEFSDELPDGKKEIGLVLRMDNGDFPQISIDFYRLDGTNCVLVINGETIGLVGRANVVDLIEAANGIVLG